MTPRTITITVGDYQRLEQKWLADLAQARREAVVYERRMGELETMLDAMQAELDRALARAEDADQALRQMSREGVTP
jgi:predicted  nucleic acid-binding Zn-ribbon protein